MIKEIININLVPIIFDYNYLIVNLFLLIPYILITVFYFILLLLQRLPTKLIQQ